MDKVFLLLFVHKKKTSFPKNFPKPPCTAPSDAIYNLLMLATALLADLRAIAHHAAPQGAVALWHALIVAALDRLLASLQAAFAFWQSGQRTPPEPAPRTCPARAHAPRIRSRSTTTPRIRPAHQVPPTHLTPAHPPRAPTLPKPAHTSPDRAIFSNAPLPLSPMHAHVVTLSKHNRTPPLPQPRTCRHKPRFPGGAA